MFELKIYYEDTDAGGVVYYANYLRYFERARVEYFHERGMEIKDLADQGMLFVVARTEIDYHYSAELGDILQIETKISDIKKVSFWFEYIIKRKKDDKIIVTGKTKMACINNDRKVKKIPQEIIGKLCK